MHCYDNTVIRSWNDCHTWSVRWINLNQIAVVLVLVFLLITQQEELMGYFNEHPWWVARTKIWAIGVNFDQGKRNLVQVRGEFKLS